MIIKYTPAGGEAELYDASVLKVSEASIVQRTVDMKWQEILRGLEFDDLDAMRGIVWVLKKRTQPALRFGEFDPGVTEMTTCMDNREVAAYVDAAVAAAESDVSMEQLAELLASRLPDISLDPDYARAQIAEKTRVPKADPAQEPEDSGAPSLPEDSPSPTSSTPEPSTSDSSPTSSTSLLPSSTT